MTTNTETKPIVTNPSEASAKENNMNDKSVIIMGSQSPALPRGRLMFALDATASRAPTWAIARELQAKMFREAAPIGKLDVQLVYYRGDECRTSKWVSSGEQLAHR